MSTRIDLPLNGPTYLARGRAANLQDCINWYPEKDPTSPAKVVLYPTPGSRFIDDIGTTATNPIRGLVTDPFEPDERMWAVVGDQLFTIAPQGPTSTVGYVEASYWNFNYTEADATGTISTEAVTTTTIGTMTGIATDTPIMMEVNNDFVFILAAGDGEAWVYDKAAATLTEVTDADYPKNQTPALEVNTTAYHDGYFIVTVKDSEQFYVSDLNDPTSWSALQFASAEKHSDALVRAVSTKKELWLLGKTTTEVWHNTGASFPFEPLQNVFFDVGCLAPLSVAKIDDNVVFLGRDGTGWGKVFLFSGFQYKSISNPAIENLLNIRINTFNLDTNVDTFTDNIVSYTYKDRGHSFYVLTIPASLTTDGQGLTLVYDLTQDFWHQRASTFIDDDGTTTISGRHFTGETFAMSRYKHYAGHYVDSDLHKLDADEFTDFTVRDTTGSITSFVLINRQRTSPWISDRRLRVFWNSLEIDTQHGELTTTGTGSANINISFSDDDGQNFSSSVNRSIGSPGETRRLKINRLGHSRDRVYRITTSSPAQVIILGTAAEITQGVS